MKSPALAWVICLGMAACDSGSAVPAGVGGAGAGGAGGATTTDGGGIVRGNPEAGAAILDGPAADAPAGGGGGGGGGGVGGSGGAGGTGGGAKLDGPAGADGGGPDAAAAIPCPSSLPQGGPCAPEGRVCQYGEDPRGDNCRPSAVCTAGAWMLRLTGCPPTPKPDSCPASREAAVGKACSPMGAYCPYGDLHCLCATCAPNAPVCQIGPSLWYCTAPSTVPGCPDAMPNLGTPCAREGVTCGYDCNSALRACQGGIWVGKPNSCPRS
jgi:hypothetical protein